MRIPILLKLLPKLFEAKKPVLLVSSPGVGKTDTVKQAANLAGHDLIITHPVVSDPTDFKGLPFMVMEKNHATARFLPIGHMRAIVEATRPTVCFLDDLGQAPPATQAAAMQLLLSRSLDEHKVSDLVTFVAATNRKEDRAGVTGILEPVKSRFTTIVHVEAHPDDWTEWAIKHGLPIELIAFVNFRPGMITAFEATAEMVNSPSPRTIAAVGDLMNMNLEPIVFNEAARGAVGTGFTAELMAYLEVYKDLPSLDEYIKAPDTTPIPPKTKLSARFAVVAGLAMKASKENVGPVVKVLNRFSADNAPEFAVMGMRMAVARDPELAATRAAAEWISKNFKVFSND